MKLIRGSQASRMLGIDTETLRRHESPDGKWAYVYGGRIRVWKLDLSPHAQRRYDENEIRRLLDRLEREAAEH